MLKLSIKWAPPKSLTHPTHRKACGRPITISVLISKPQRSGPTWMSKAQNRSLSGGPQAILHFYHLSTVE